VRRLDAAFTVPTEVCQKNSPNRGGWPVVQFWLYAEIARRRQAAALQGAFGTPTFRVAKKLAYKALG
jgi:hypothetical protein